MHLVTKTLGILEVQNNEAEAIADLAGRPVTVLVFLASEESLSHAQALAWRVDDLLHLDAIAREKILSDYDTKPNDENWPKHYVEEHLEYVDEAKLLAVLEVGSKAEVEPRNLLGRLRLATVAIHAGDDGAELVCDYTLGKDVTDTILAVKFDSEGEVLRVDMES